MRRFLFVLVPTAILIPALACSSSTDVGIEEKIEALVLIDDEPAEGLRVVLTTTGVADTVMTNAEGRARFDVDIVFDQLYFLRLIDIPDGVTFTLVQRQKVIRRANPEFTATFTGTTTGSPSG